ncbi:MAG: O-antigen ligase family protein [Saprospiraceae bacterium]|jgi:O-antigen ligase
MNRLKNIILVVNKLHLYLGIVALAILISILTSNWYILLIPMVILLGGISITQPKWIFYLLLLSLPISTEISFSNGLGTDLPSEPLMIGLCIIAIPLFITQPKILNKAFWTHPITLILGAHLGWTLIATLYSANPLVSFKFLLAKTWYIVVFYFLTPVFLKSRQDFLKAIPWVIWPLALTVVITLIRHYQFSFSFSEVHKVFHPYQRNHVNYGAMLALCLPFVLLMWQQLKGNSKKIGFVLGILFLIGIYFSYTRAAYIAVLLIPFLYFVLIKNILKPLLLIGGLGTILAFSFLTSENKYLDFAPNYETTISHYNFENLLEATYKGQDISTMERFYRWIAGIKMGWERVITGFGPGNFVNFYKTYTVSSFSTYVSDNKEGSGIHSYFLMLLAEQGIPGLLIFLTLLLITLFYGQNLVNQLKGQPERNLILALVSSLLIIIAFLTINDLVETDKVGPFFFISLSLIASFSAKETSRTISSSLHPHNLK